MLGTHTHSGPRRKPARSARITRARAVAFLGTILIASPWPRDGAADTIHLKGGKTLQGIVDASQSGKDKDSIWVRTNTGMMKVARSKIERIETRENMTPEEKKGDLLASEGDLDGALAQYVRAKIADPKTEELSAKLASMRAQIRERDDKQFGLQFEKIDKAIKGRDFEAAIQLGRDLRAKSDRASVRERINEKIATAHVEAARESFNTVNYPQAERSYRLAIEADPASPFAYLELAGLVHGNPSRQQEAFELYKNGLERAAANPDALPQKRIWDYQLDYARLHASNSKYRDAILLYWKVAEADPRERGPKAMDAMVKAAKPLQTELVERKPENDDPLATLKKVCALRPQDAQLNYILGKVAYDRLEFAEAVPYFAAALKSYAPDTPQGVAADTFYYQAISLRKTNHETEAITHLDRVIELQPTRYEALCERGEVYFSLANYADALVNFQAAIKTEPGNYRAYLGAGRALRRVDKFAEAAVMYEELIKLRDDHADYYFELGQTYAKIDRHEEAIATYKRSLELAEKMPQDSPENRLLLGEIYAYVGLSVVQLKRYNEGVEVFEKSLGYHPDYAMALSGEGEAYREIGDFKKAEQFYRKAMDVEPTEPKHALSLGVLYHKYVKDLKGALPFYMSYFEKGGADPQVADWIRECGGSPPAVKKGA